MRQHLISFQVQIIGRAFFRKSQLISTSFSCETEYLVLYLLIIGRALALSTNEETIIQSTGVVTHHAARENCLPNETVESARAILFQKVATHIELDSKVLENTC